MHSKLPNVATSIFSIMSKMAMEHGAINLSQGFPDFPSDPILIEQVSRAMQEGFNQYAPMPGDLKLRERIAQKIVNAHAKEYDPGSEITITAGATQAIFTAIAALIKSGDEVIVFTPAYDCYEPTIELFGGKVVAIQLRLPDFRPDWEEVSEAITSKTRMIIINTPHNPSGMMFTREDMQELERLVCENELYLLSDEVYEHIIFDGKLHQSAAGFSDLVKRTFITASFGKTFHNTGWKIGYCTGPSYLMEEFRKVHQFNVFSVNHPIQKALAVYMEDPDTYMKLGGFYQQKRDFFLGLISNSRFTFTPSKGTYFQLLNYSEITSESDLDFTKRLTIVHKLATIPVSVFNKNQQDFNQIRVCFAKTEDTLKAAADILNAL
jgi:methionine aminotransferase